MGGDAGDEVVTAHAVFAVFAAETCKDLSNQVADRFYPGCTGRTLCHVCSVAHV